MLRTLNLTNAENPKLFLHHKSRSIVAVALGAACECIISMNFPHLGYLKPTIA